MIGGLISGVVGAGMQVAGAISGNKAARRAAERQKKIINEQKKENQDWYDRRYNEDATQRADAQRVLTMTQDSLRKANKQAQATAAVMGGTNESVAAEKAASNKALADTMSQISASAADRKDQIEGQYRQRNADLAQQLMDVEAQRAQNAMQASQGLAQAGQTIAGSGSAISSLLGK